MQVYNVFWVKERETMKKKFFSMLLVMIMCCSFINIPDVSARSLSAAEMKERLAVLKSKYPTGWYWADGWCNNYETGDCGPGYNNAAWECMGFAYKICNELFEEDPRMKFYQHNNILIVRAHNLKYRLVMVLNPASQI